MRRYKFQSTFACCFILVILFCLVSCNNQAKSLNQNQIKTIRDSVKEMMNSISKDVSNNGPIAWTKYFENSQNFFMASEGQLIFPSDDSAESFIKNTLVKQIRKINLQWNNIEIDPLTLKLAGVAANWHEEITDFTNNKTSQVGYFTAITENTSKGWQLRNAHWSAIK